MITLINGNYQIECDGGCGQVNYTGQNEFRQALNVARAEAWEHRRPGAGSWRNFCPYRANEPDPTFDLAGVHFFAS
jgi:hypothetical protein